MVGWHHQLNGHEFEQTLGDNEGLGRLDVTAHGVTKCWTRLSDWTTTTAGVRTLLGHEGETLQNTSLLIENLSSPASREGKP